jgi:hypothetical protein
MDSLYLDVVNKILSNDFTGAIPIAIHQITNNEKYLTFVVSFSENAVAGKKFFMINFVSYFHEDKSIYPIEMLQHYDSSVSKGHIGYKLSYELEKLKKVCEIDHDLLKITAFMIDSTIVVIFSK